MVQSIGRELIREGYTVYYRSIFDCVRDFLHDEAFEGHDKIMNRYLKPDLLILDDMGMKYDYVESEGGHIWRNWRVYLTQFAPLLFK